MQESIRRQGRLWRCGNPDFVSDVATPVVYQLKVSLRGISPMTIRNIGGRDKWRWPEGPLLTASLKKWNYNSNF